jgi:hypothetical protein
VESPVASRILEFPLTVSPRSGLEGDSSEGPYLHAESSLSLCHGNTKIAFSRPGMGLPEVRDLNIEVQVIVQKDALDHAPGEGLNRKGVFPRIIKLFDRH